MTLSRLRDALASGYLTPADILARSAGALAALNPVLNLAIPSDDAVPAVAGEPMQDDAWRPLAGIALAHKDMFDRRGHRCSFGSRMPQDRPAERTATAIARLEAAGATAFGALQMAEFALGPTGHNLVFGDCRNPWSLDHITGGSSSGSATAVAAGIVAGSLGADTGGSIRIPAACCGVTGLKPTAGAVDATGAMTLSASLDCIGPIARTVDDCQLLFNLISVRRWMPLPDHDLRIGYAVHAPSHSISPVVAGAVRSAVGTLAGIGLGISEAVLPDITELHGLADIVQKVESTAVHLARLAAQRQLYSEHVRKRLSGGLFVPAIAYHHAVRQRPAHLARFVRHSLADIDALIIPTLGFPVPLRSETDERRSADTFARVARMTEWTRWLNYLGVPALTIPCGFDPNGLPIGLQIVGRPNSEHILFQIGPLFQDATEWHLPKPPHYIHIV